MLLHSSRLTRIPTETRKSSGRCARVVELSWFREQLLQCGSAPSGKPIEWSRVQCVVDSSGFQTKLDTKYIGRQRWFTQSQLSLQAKPAVAKNQTSSRDFGRRFLARRSCELGWYVQALHRTKDLVDCCGLCAGERNWRVLAPALCTICARGLYHSFELGHESCHEHLVCGYNV